MKILVCGSRELTNRNTVWNALDQHINHPALIVIHGACPTGADRFAHQWCDRSLFVYEIAVPAKWDIHGKYAGPHRNTIMAELQPNLVLAFYKTGAANRGTSNMVANAKKAGVTNITEIWGQ